MSNIAICSKCGKDTGKLECNEKPETYAGLPIGMYHCPDCGEMLVAGTPHMYLCHSCEETMYDELEKF